MKKISEVRLLKKRVKELKEEICRKNKYIDKLQLDRILYRNKVVQYFKWFVKLSGTGKTPSLSWSIIDLSRTLNAGEPFYIDPSEE